jgi:hypothetical protein
MQCDINVADITIYSIRFHYKIFLSRGEEKLSSPSSRRSIVFVSCAVRLASAQQLEQLAPGHCGRVGPRLLNCQHENKG